MDATSSVMEYRDLFIPEGEYIKCLLRDDENIPALASQG